MKESDVTPTGRISLFLVLARFLYVIYEVFSYFRSMEKPFEEWAKTVQGDNLPSAWRGVRTHWLDIWMVATGTPGLAVSILI